VIDERTMVFADALRKARIVPVIRLSDSAAALDVLGRVAEAGLPAAELTATTPGWADALTQARQRWPAMLTGLGTVVTAADARLAAGLGAAFLVSPYPVPGVRDVAAGAGLPIIEGGFTPAEIADAASRGIAKLFPAHIGGIEYLRSLLSILPDALIVPTGGIAPAAAADWLRAGALAVGVGRALLDGDVNANLSGLRA
jgi:2-dehydro-3-deoxyphosphogluconate aldolase / (4S)-4-hydroxy-2-oxoglutarate aldolase